jgi:hypothetical protein
MRPDEEFEPMMKVQNLGDQEVKITLAREHLSQEKHHAGSCLRRARLCRSGQGF